jgi:hypothetical protein
MMIKFDKALANAKLNSNKKDQNMVFLIIYTF